jgi:hypothetical protein
MTTANLYRQLVEGKISKEKWLYEVRRDPNLPWVNNLTSYNDSVTILKQKGIIKEEIDPKISALAKGSIQQGDKSSSGFGDVSKYEGVFQITQEPGGVIIFTSKDENALNKVNDEKLDGKGNITPSTKYNGSFELKFHKSIVSEIQVKVKKIYDDEGHKLDETTKNPNDFELGQDDDAENAPDGVNDKAPSKPIKDKVSIKSVLEKIVQKVWSEKNLDAAKKMIIDFVSQSQIKDEDKKKILNNIKPLTSKMKLDQYLANSLLGYEGHGLSQLRNEMEGDLTGITGRGGNNVDKSKVQQLRANHINRFAKSVKDPNVDTEELAQEYMGAKFYPDQSVLTTDEIKKILMKYNRWDEVKKHVNDLLNQDDTDPAGGHGLESHVEENKEGYTDVDPTPYIYLAAEFTDEDLEPVANRKWKNPMEIINVINDYIPADRQKEFQTQAYQIAGPTPSKKPIKEAKESNKDYTKELLKKNAPFNDKAKNNADFVIWAEYQRGIVYELEKQGDLDLEKAQKKALSNLQKDNLFYTRILSGQSIKDLEKLQKPVGRFEELSKKGNDKAPNQMTTEKKNESNVANKAKKDKKTNSKKFKIMSVAPKKSKGIKAMETPGKAKKIKLKEGSNDDSVKDNSFKVWVQDIVNWLGNNWEFSQEEAYAFVKNNLKTIKAQFQAGSKASKALDAVIGHQVKANESELDELSSSTYKSAADKSMDQGRVGKQSKFLNQGLFKEFIGKDLFGQKIESFNANNIQFHCNLSDGSVIQYDNRGSMMYNDGKSNKSILRTGQGSIPVERKDAVLLLKMIKTFDPNKRLQATDFTIKGDRTMDEDIYKDQQSGAIQSFNPNDPTDKKTLNDPKFRVRYKKQV